MSALMILGTYSAQLALASILSFSSSFSGRVLSAAQANPALTVLAGVLGAALGVLGTVVAKLFDKGPTEARVAIEGFDSLAERLLASEEATRKELRRLRARVRSLERVLQQHGIPLPQEDEAEE